MALLSVFEQAGALPPESSPEANGLIHALIQTQAALTKSSVPATRRWFSEALQSAAPQGSEAAATEGLTSRTLEAILVYAARHPPGEDREVLAGLRAFNISTSDFDLMARVYRHAKDKLRAEGRDIHHVYDQERRAMPFR
jgi:hypothetical protein